MVQEFGTSKHNIQIVLETKTGWYIVKYRVYDTKGIARLSPAITYDMRNWSFDAMLNDAKASVDKGEVR